MSYQELKPEFLFLEEVNSTNTRATELLKLKQASHGTSIIAEKQWAGKGQRGNVWESEPGLNLTCSVIIYPTLSASKVFYLNMCVSLAVQEVLSDLTAKEPLIKWPNDILFKEQKTAGILIENQIKGDLIVSAIVGIGVNVNQKNFSSNLRATSMSLVAEKDFEVKTVFEQIHLKLDSYLNVLRCQNFKLIDQRYRQVLYGIGMDRFFSNDHEKFEGRILGVDENGRLRVQHKSNDHIRKYDLKEIRFEF